MQKIIRGIASDLSSEGKGVVKYQKDWSNWEMPATCEASYLDWSLGTTFDQEYIVE